MKIEYLLIKTQNDFCSTVDQFKSLLLSNKRLSIDEKSIKFSGVSFGYTLTAQEVVWKKNKEIVFYFCASGEEANIDKLEDLEKIEMVRGLDGRYRMDHAVTATQKTILGAFMMDARSVKNRANELGELLAGIEV